MTRSFLQERYKFIILFFIVIELSFVLYLVYNGNNDSYLCKSFSSCSLVQESQYGNIFGIKLAWFGLIGFSSLLFFYLLSFLNNKIYSLFLFLAVVGALFALYFIYIQLFVLQAICSVCLIIDITMLIIFVFAILSFKKN